jgi:hypothetical protein
MELREYIRIIKRNKGIFFSAWFLVVALSLAWYFFRPIAFDVSMPVEIARMGQEKTPDYQYDQYYRLQADEKYAETVSQWLKDPSIVNEIFSRAGIATGSKWSLRSFSKAFSAEKLSSNYVQVKFSVPLKENGEKITAAIRQVLEEKNQEINKQSKAENWFELVFGGAVLVQSRINFLVVLILSMIGGLLLAIFSTLVKEYWYNEF